MKIKILSGTLLFPLLLAFGCAPQKTEKTNDARRPYPVNLDGLSVEQKLHKLNALSDSIYNLGNVEAKTIYPRFFSEKDIAVLRGINGEPTLWVLSAFPPNAETRDFFFFKNGVLINFKHREWFKTNNPRTKEINCFMDKDGVFHILERSMPLSPGQNPSPVLNLAYTESKMDKDSMFVVIKKELSKLETAAGQR